MSTLSLADFGKLVRKRRAEKQLSQEALALIALSNADRKGYISQLENGKLPNITALTLQKIAKALDIPESQISALLGVTAPTSSEIKDELDSIREKCGSLQVALENTDQLTRSFLIALASQFNRGDAYTLSDPELRTFLNGKAGEYRELIRLVGSLSEGLLTISERKLAAEEAAERLDFLEVEAQLSLVHEVEVSAAADTIEARAYNSMVLGNLGRAYDFFVSAADMLFVVDREEAVRRRLKYMRWVAFDGLGGSRDRYDLHLFYAAQLGRGAVSHLLHEINLRLWSELQRDLGTVLFWLAQAKEGKERRDILLEALTAKYRSRSGLLEIPQGNEGIASFASPFGDRVVADILMEIGLHDDDASTMKCLERARLEYEEYIRRLPTVIPNDVFVKLGEVLIELALRSERASRIDLLVNARSCFSEAVKLHRRREYPLIWADAKLGLAKVDLETLKGEESSEGMFHVSRGLRNARMGCSIYQACQDDLGFKEAENLCKVFKSLLGSFATLGD